MLLLAAFTHPSYRTLDPTSESYERLEFLGDAVLNLVVAEVLFRTMPTAPEGVLTERRADLVNRDALASIFDRLELVRFLRAAPEYVPSLKDKANIVEALFGAVLLGRDFLTCHILWQALAIPMSLRPPPVTHSPAHVMYQSIYQSLGIAPTATRNAKNALQELCQKQDLPLPTYEEVTRTGPEHRPQFLVRLMLRPFARDPAAVFEATGEGLTRKAAEIHAAERLCDQISLPYRLQN